MRRSEIQNTIDQVCALFAYGEEIESPVIAILNEELWRKFAFRNGYSYRRNQSMSIAHEHNYGKEGGE